jgi:translation initiation factor IF-2
MLTSVALFPPLYVDPGRFGNIAPARRVLRTPSHPYRLSPPGYRPPASPPLPPARRPSGTAAAQPVRRDRPPALPPPAFPHLGKRASKEALTLVVFPQPFSESLHPSQAPPLPPRPGRPCLRQAPTPARPGWPAPGRPAGRRRGRGAGAGGPGWQAAGAVLGNNPLSQPAGLFRPRSPSCHSRRPFQPRGPARPIGPAPQASRACRSAGRNRRAGRAGAAGICLSEKERGG